MEASSSPARHAADERKAGDLLKASLLANPKPLYDSNHLSGATRDYHLYLNHCVRSERPVIRSTTKDI